MNSFIFNSDSNSKDGVKSITPRDKKRTSLEEYPKKYLMNINDHLTLNVNTTTLNSPNEATTTLDKYNAFSGSTDSYSTTSTTSTTTNNIEEAITTFNNNNNNNDNDIIPLRPYPSPCVNYATLENTEISPFLKNNIAMTPISVTNSTFNSIVNSSSSNATSIQLNSKPSNLLSTSFQNTLASSSSSSTYDHINIKSNINIDMNNDNNASSSSASTTTNNNQININALTNTTITGKPITTLSGNLPTDINNIDLSVNMNQNVSTSPIVQNTFTFGASNPETLSYQTSFPNENLINNYPLNVSLQSHFSTSTSLPVETITDATTTATSTSSSTTISTTAVPSNALTNYSNQIQPLYSISSSNSSDTSSTYPSDSSSDSSSGSDRISDKNNLRIIIPSNQSTTSMLMNNNISPVILTSTTNDPNQLVSPLYTTAPTTTDINTNPTENISYLSELNNQIVGDNDYSIVNPLAETTFMNTPPPFHRTVTKANSDPLFYCLINNSFSDLENSLLEEGRNNLLFNELCESPSSYSSQSAESNSITNNAIIYNANNVTVNSNITNNYDINSLNSCISNCKYNSPTTYVPMNAIAQDIPMNESFMKISSENSIQNQSSQTMEIEKTLNATQIQPLSIISSNQETSLPENIDLPQNEGKSTNVFTSFPIKLSSKDVNENEKNTELSIDMENNEESEVITELLTDNEKTELNPVVSNISTVEDKKLTGIEEQNTTVNSNLSLEEIRKGAVTLLNESKIKANSIRKKLFSDTENIKILSIEDVFGTEGKEIATKREENQSVQPMELELDKNVFKDVPSTSSTMIKEINKSNQKQTLKLKKNIEKMEEVEKNKESRLKSKSKYAQEKQGSKKLNYKEDISNGQEFEKNKKDLKSEMDTNKIKKTKIKKENVSTKKIRKIKVPKKVKTPKSKSLTTTSSSIIASSSSLIKKNNSIKMKEAIKDNIENLTHHSSLSTVSKKVKKGNDNDNDNDNSNNNKDSIVNMNKETLIKNRDNSVNMNKETLVKNTNKRKRIMNDEEKSKKKDEKESIGLKVVKKSKTSVIKKEKNKIEETNNKDEENLSKIDSSDLLKTEISILPQENKDTIEINPKNEDDVKPKYIPLKKNKATKNSKNNGKPYDPECECDICHKIFSRKYDLIRHRRLHTGDTPYKCKICGQGFTRSDHRDRHIRRTSCGESKYYQEIMKKAEIEKAKKLEKKRKREEKRRRREEQERKEKNKKKK
jgi:hypothetical protein